MALPLGSRYPITYKRRRELLDAGQKLCIECLETKPIDAFGIDRAKVSGRRGRCRECEAPLKRVADSARYYADVERSRAKGRDVARRSHQRNPDLARQRARRSNAAWKVKDPEGYRRNQIRSWRARRAREHGAIVCRRIDYERVCVRDRMRCHICKKRVAENDLEFDHVIPLAKGGSHTEANVAVSHMRCNRTKGAKALTLF